MYVCIYIYVYIYICMYIFRGKEPINEPISVAMSN